jgi:predicted ATPase
MPYHPILELLRRALHVSEGASGSEIRDAVAGRLQALGVDDEEPAILLAHLLGVTAPKEVLNRLAPARLRERTFRALSTILLRAGDGQPLVIIVENIHWLDASSDEFLQHWSVRCPVDPLC